MVPRHYDPASGKVVIQSFLVRAPRHTILVDACAGNRKCRNPEFFDDAAFPGSFSCRRRDAEEIDFVLRTHVDHVGWNARLGNGRWVPTFPNAKYIFARSELDFWLRQSERNQMTRTGGCVADCVIPIFNAGRELPVETDRQIDDRLALEPLPGHTPGMVGLCISSKRRETILCGDLMHHMIQCHVPGWSTIACADREAARATREAFLDRYAETDVTVVPSHFPNPAVGAIVPCGEAFAFRYMGE